MVLSPPFRFAASYRAESIPGSSPMSFSLSPETAPSNADTCLTRWDICQGLMAPGDAALLNWHRPYAGIAIEARIAAKIPRAIASHGRRAAIGQVDHHRQQGD